MNMNKLKNLFSIFLAICFMVWFFYSFYTPIKNFFTVGDTESKLLGFTTIVVLGFLVTRIIPRALKGDVDPLNYKVGSTKKGGCSSCKKRKKS